MDFIDLSGLWACEIPGQRGQVRLPGTLDEAGMGFPDAVKAPWHPDERVNAALAGADVIATRFTRRVTYEGPAVLTRRVKTGLPAGKRAFFVCGRARALKLYVNGVPAPEAVPPTLSTPRHFEVTDLLTGDDEFLLISDNSYPGWPRRALLASSAATDETQTNWNGVLGRVGLVLHDSAFFASLRVYPRGDKLELRWEVDGETSEPVRFSCDALEAPAAVDSAAGTCLLPLRRDVRRWDEGEGNLYTLTAALGAERLSVRFGVRSFTALEGMFALNGRKLFLRSEANCAVFPETGYEPMDTGSWRKILRTYSAYGVNHLRFHSHCPPEAAFEAADELGLLLQPELSLWDPRDAFGDEVSRNYYRTELREILKAYANHPSFVMLSLGNELQAGDAGRAFMEELLALAHALDDTRLYAPGSNNDYGQRKPDAGADYYTSCAWLGRPLRAANAGMTGWLNEGKPLDTDYTEAMAAARADFSGPVMSFEVGQYEVLPDFAELDAFCGVTDPANLRLIRERVERRGLLPRWGDYVAASGELSRLCYRAEVEAALATPGLGGIGLLGLQDFPGQGTALVGMLNAHLEPKPCAFARPERFRSFFTGVLPLIRLKTRTFAAGETLTARCLMANYGKKALTDTPRWRLAGPGAERGGALPPVTAGPGGLTELGTLTVPWTDLPAPAAYTLTLTLAGIQNTYALWLYPDEPVRRPDGVYECQSLDKAALAVLQRGGAVLLAPDLGEAAPPGAVKGQFSTDFWSVGTFPQQSGAMGLLIDDRHPVFRGFPTGAHTDYQWRGLAGAYALRVPEGTERIVTLMDSYAYLRALSCLFECRCLAGRLLVSTFGLHRLDAPEARALQSALYAYMASPDFAPRQVMTPETIRKIMEGAI